MWTEDGRLVDGDGQEIMETEQLLAQLAIVLKDKKLYEENNKPVTEKQEQIEWIKSRLPFKIYEWEEIQALFELYQIEYPTDGSGRFFSGIEWQLGEIRGQYLKSLVEAEVQYFAVWEPEFIEWQWLRPHPFNAEIYGFGEDLSELIALIRGSGWVKRLIINLKGEVIAGNRRLLCCQALNWPSRVAVEFIRLPEDSERQLLLLDNASREKSNEQKVREALFWMGNDDWLKGKRSDRKVKGQSSKSRDIVAQHVGLGSGYTLDKARKVIDLLDLLHSQERNLECSELRSALNKSVDAAYQIYRQWEDAQNPERFSYTGKEIDQLKTGSEVCLYPGIVESDPEIVWVSAGNPTDRYRVRRSQLKPLELEVPEKPQKQEEKARSRWAKNAYVFVKTFNCVGRLINRIEDGWLVRIDGQEEMVAEDDLLPVPKFQLSDSVVSVYRENQVGKLLQRQWVNNEWFYRVQWLEGQIEDLAESKLSLQLSLLQFKQGSFYSDGRDLAFCVWTTISRVNFFFLGMGDAPGVGKSGYVNYSLELDSEILETFVIADFDPLKPPRCCLRNLKAGDLVAPKNSTQRGIIEGFHDDHWTIDWQDGDSSSLSTDQLVLLGHWGYEVGRLVHLEDCPVEAIAKRWGDQEGIIKNLYRTCADVAMGSDLLRLPLQWLRSTPISEQVVESAIDYGESIFGDLLKLENETEVLEAISALDRVGLVDVIIDSWKQRRLA